MPDPEIKNEIKRMMEQKIPVSTSEIAERFHIDKTEAWDLTVDALLENAKPHGSSKTS